MSTQRITVSWDAETATPTAPDTIVTRGNGAVVLQWEGDSTIGSITGITFENNAGQFTQPQSSSAKVWTCTDHATADGSWSYSIAGTQASSGHSGMSDPMITNQSAPAV